MTSKGHFITFEGIEGVGKSTQCQRVVDWLQGLGLSVVRTREPGGTEIAEMIRSIFVSHHQEPMDAMTELLLVFAARAQHLAHKIRPALAEGKWVVCDRFTDASFAYQGARDSLPTSAVADLELLVQGGLQPDLTILLDLPVAMGRTRMMERPDVMDRIETEDVGFFERVRQLYLERAAASRDRMQVVDADGSVDAVFLRVQQCFQHQWDVLLHA